MEEKGMESRFIHFKKRFVPAVSRALMGVMLMSTTITNRMLHGSYTPEQKEEVKKALAAGVPKATILTYF